MPHDESLAFVLDKVMQRWAQVHLNGPKVNVPCSILGAFEFVSFIMQRNGLAL